MGSLKALTSSPPTLPPPGTFVIQPQPQKHWSFDSAPSFQCTLSHRKLDLPAHLRALTFTSREALLYQVKGSRFMNRSHDEDLKPWEWLIVMCVWSFHFCALHPQWTHGQWRPHCTSWQCVTSNPHRFLRSSLVPWQNSAGTSRQRRTQKKVPFVCVAPSKTQQQVKHHGMISLRFTLVNTNHLTCSQYWVSSPIQTWETPFVTT